MVDEILNATGIAYKETRFIQPPDGTYAIYLLAKTFRGSDDSIRLEECDATIELYSEKIDSVSEAKIEAELMSRAVEFDKSDHIWLETEQLYEVVYSFEYIEKRR